VRKNLCLTTALVAGLALAGCSSSSSTKTDAATPSVPFLFPDLSGVLASEAPPNSSPVPAEATGPDCKQVFVTVLNGVHFDNAEVVLAKTDRPTWIHLNDEVNAALAANPTTATGGECQMIDLGSAMYWDHALAEALAPQLDPNMDLFLATVEP
jgi:hypothetical protein